LETFQITNPDAYKNSRQAQRNSQGMHMGIDNTSHNSARRIKKSLISATVEEDNRRFYAADRIFG
jgi:hypothetical protein